VPRKTTLGYARLWRVGANGAKRAGRHTRCLLEPRHGKGIVAPVTREEFSRLRQTVSPKGRFTGLRITPHPYGEDDLAATVQLPSGHRLIFNTWQEFHDWYTSPAPF
jgi:hypothetical protein